MQFTYDDLELWAELFEINIFGIEDLLAPYAVYDDDGNVLYWEDQDSDNSTLPDIIDQLVTKQTGLTPSQIGAIIGGNT